MQLKPLIKYSELKKQHKLNDNVAKIILHLGKQPHDSFREMIQANVIPKNTKCFRDLSANINTFIHTWREGRPLIHNATLTTKGKQMFEMLNNL